MKRSGPASEWCPRPAAHRDSRSDLVFWNEGHFEVHLQDQRGLFAPEAKTFTTDVAFDSDDLTSLAAPQGCAGGVKITCRPET